MAPKKRSQYVERHNSMKRSYDHSERNGIIEAKKTCVFRREKEMREIDKYCWICHKLAQGTNCNICMRVYHDDCLTRSTGKFNNLKVCPECQMDSMDGTGISEYLHLDVLRKLLQAVTIRVYEQKREKREILLRWPENLGINKLVKIIDFEILIDYINKDIHYTKISDFYSDIKFMYHNCCIMYGANSEQARAAEQMRRHFKKELFDLESCPECYHHLYCDESNELDPFVRLCDPPHDIVWAQLTGHPYWPAKCLKVVKGIAHVRFFGEHEVSDLPLSKIFHISESHPKFKNSKITSSTNSGPKSLRYKAAIMELEKYIQLYTRVYEEFPYYPHRTHYKPGESQHEKNLDEVEVVSNAENEENELSYGSNRSTQLKLEGNIQNEDSSTVGFIEDISTHGIISGENNNDPLNSSAVTSVDMTFTTVAPDPIVTGITSLSTDCFSRSTANESIDLDNILKTNELKSIKEIAARTIAPVAVGAVEHSEGTILSGNPMSLLNPSINLAQDSSTISSQISIADRNGEPIPAVPDEAQNENSNASAEIVSSPSESVDDDDDDVIIIEPPAKEPPFNPAYVLPFILEQDENLKKLYQHGQFIMNALFVRMWAICQKTSTAPEIITTAIMEKKKFEKLCSEAESRRVESENNLKIRTDELAKSQFENDLLLKEVKRLKDELKNQIGRPEQDELKYQTALKNSKLVTDGLRNQLAKEDKQWTEKYNALLIQMEEVTKERDKFRAEIEKCKIYYNDLKEKSRSYRVNDYCYVCEDVANIHCCLNHNYCGATCRKSDFSNHVKFCPNKKRRLSNLDLAPINQQSMQRKKVRIQRHTKTVANIHIEVEQKSSEIISTSETREFTNTSSICVETRVESSTATYAETHNQSIQSSPASPTPELSD